MPKQKATPHPVKAALFERGYTQKQMAAKLGISPSEASRIARGMTPPPEQRREIAMWLRHNQRTLWPHLNGERGSK